MSKKHLIIDHKLGSSLFSLRFSAGGVLPEELSGEFISTRDAEKARDRYYANGMPKKMQPVVLSRMHNSGPLKSMPLIKEAV